MPSMLKGATWKLKAGTRHGPTGCAKFPSICLQMCLCTRSSIARTKRQFQSKPYFVYIQINKLTTKQKNRPLYSLFSGIYLYANSKEPARVTRHWD